jgi:hypothetical protein
MREATAHDVLRAVARRRFAHAGPYRMGLLVGWLGLNVPCPYAPGSKAARTWASGVEVGRANPGSY